jgi:ring-1,2-phenylacetyl-CoA epoxidase subunit PaaD
VVKTSRVDQAWAVLAEVLDPEVPVLSVLDLGIVRAVADVDGELHVTLTPTYSGCPATEAIEQAVQSALITAGLGPVHLQTQRAPAWSSDWISPQGRDKLREYGIAPPACVQNAEQPVAFVRQAVVPCPRCASRHTERLSTFGATACKALYRCLACREPFEYFKPI